MSKQEKRYTFRQVRNTLCEACKYGVPIGVAGFHVMNGELIPCDASMWYFVNGMKKVGNKDRKDIRALGNRLSKVTIGKRPDITVTPYIGQKLTY